MLVVDTKSTQLLMTLTLQSIICGLSLLLRDHLKTLYSVKWVMHHMFQKPSNVLCTDLTFSDVKMSKYTVGKKSTVGDRVSGDLTATHVQGADTSNQAAMRRVDVLPTLDSESYSRLPFAMRPLLTREDAVSQRDTVCPLPLAVLSPLMSPCAQYISLIAEDGTVGADFEDDV
jgi:hypothetical protein